MQLSGLTTIHDCEIRALDVVGQLGKLLLNLKLNAFETGKPPNTPKGLVSRSRIIRPSLRCGKS